MSDPAPISARATARALGISADKLMALYRTGAIDAEIHEGRVIRFDVEAVRLALRERAKASRPQQHKAGRMVPII